MSVRPVGRVDMVMGLPELNSDFDAMMAKATIASNLLKAIGHEGRMMILCHLATGEKSVTELERLLSTRQAAVSQQLARLRLEGLIAARREGKSIHYRLADERARRVVELVYDLFCGAEDASDGPQDGKTAPWT